MKGKENMENKERLDSFLVKQEFFNSRQKAKFAIDNGNIYINGKKEKKSSKIVSLEDKIEVKGDILPFVSRGGLKLDKAVNKFNILLKDKICMDIGASTGGFTDCMLQNKAKKVYAVDVGINQLDIKLREDKRVINMEKTNIRDMQSDTIELIDFISTDVSFISITYVLPKIYELLKIKGKAVILIKPQFEAGHQNINKNGVVKDIKIHKKIILDIILLANKIGFNIIDLDYSPIKGPAGNIEYLLYVEKNENNLLDTYSIKNKIELVTLDAFKNLK